MKSHSAQLTCTCNSCLMVFTVYGIRTARGLYVLPRAEPEEVHTARGRYYPCTVKTMGQLSCTDRPYKATARSGLSPRISLSCGFKGHTLYTHEYMLWERAWERGYIYIYTCIIVYTPDSSCTGQSFYKFALPALSPYAVR